MDEDVQTIHTAPNGDQLDLWVNAEGELVLHVWEPGGSMHSSIGERTILSERGEAELLAILRAREEARAAPATKLKSRLREQHD